MQAVTKRQNETQQLGVLYKEEEWWLFQGCFLSFSVNDILVQAQKLSFCSFICTSKEKNKQK